MDRTNLSQKELEALIAKYFDCVTSEEEEKMLKKTLANCDYSSPAIDEALVAFGFFAVGKMQAAKHRKVAVLPIARRAVSVAAVVALFVTVGVNLLGSGDMLDADECIAYVNGREVRDQEAVLALVMNDFSEVNKASASVENGIESQLSAIKGVLDIE